MKQIKRNGSVDQREGIKRNRSRATDNSEHVKRNRSRETDQEVWIKRNRSIGMDQEELIKRNRLRGMGKEVRSRRYNFRGMDKEEWIKKNGSRGTDQIDTMQLSNNFVPFKKMMFQDKESTSGLTQELSYADRVFLPVLHVSSKELHCAKVPCKGLQGAATRMTHNR